MCLIIISRTRTIKSTTFDFFNALTSSHEFFSVTATHLYVKITC